jgi:hypothetical protein
MPDPFEIETGYWERRPPNSVAFVPITDPAGFWSRFATDDKAFRRLVQEPGIAITTPTKHADKLFELYSENRLQVQEELGRRGWFEPAPDERPPIEEPGIEIPDWRSAAPPPGSPIPTPPPGYYWVPVTGGPQFVGNDGRPLWAILRLWHRDLSVYGPPGEE